MRAKKYRVPRNAPLSNETQYFALGIHNYNGGALTYILYVYECTFCYRTMIDRNAYYNSVRINRAHNSETAKQVFRKRNIFSELENNEKYVNNIRKRAVGVHAALPCVYENTRTSVQRVYGIHNNSRASVSYIYAFTSARAGT